MIEPTLVATLGALVGGRAYPDFAPAGTAKPFVTWQQVGGQSRAALDATASALKNARIQINVWAATRQEAMTLIRAIEDAVAVEPLLGVPQGGAVALYDEAAAMRGARQDFSFWFT